MNIRPPRFALALVAVIILLGLGTLPLTARSGAASTTLDAWNVDSAPSPAQSWFAVTYADGRWVALGHGTNVADSADGSTWTEYLAPEGSWGSVAYGNGEYVALSSVNSAIEEMTSVNGINWDPEPGPSGAWTDVTYGNGLFVAVSSLGEIATSSNGVNWTSAWNHRNYDLTSVTYGDGHFVAVDSAMGATIVSANGSRWSRILAAKSGLQWGAVAYGNGTFVALDKAGSGYYETSVDGYAWTLHRSSPVQGTDGVTFGCGDFVAVGSPAGSANNIMSSTTGLSWATTPVPTDVTSAWTAVGYGARRFVAVDSTGSIAWADSAPNCAAAIPTSPQQVSGNVSDGEVWTYMHPAAQAGGAPITSYRVTISNGSLTKSCVAPVSYQPHCLIEGLDNHDVLWVTAQAHNRFGYSTSSDPEFVIPVADSSLRAATAQATVAQTSPLVVQVTGVRANSEGIYPTSVVSVHFGARLATCRANPFGECLVTFSNPSVGASTIYATYSGYGRSYQSPASRVTVVP